MHAKLWLVATRSVDLLPEWAGRRIMDGMRLQPILPRRDVRPIDLCTKHALHHRACYQRPSWCIDNMTGDTVQRKQVGSACSIAMCRPCSHPIHDGAKRDLSWCTPRVHAIRCDRVGETPRMERQRRRIASQNDPRLVQRSIIRIGLKLLAQAARRHTARSHIGSTNLQKLRRRTDTDAPCAQEAHHSTSLHAKTRLLRAAVENTGAVPYAACTK